MAKNDSYTLKLQPHGRIVEAQAGITLMEALVDSSIFLRSDSGGRGNCGKCRVTTTDEYEEKKSVTTCNLKISENLMEEIPQSSMLSSHILSKAPVTFPPSFVNRDKTANDKRQGYG